MTTATNNHRFKVDDSGSHHSHGNSLEKRIEDVMGQGIEDKAVMPIERSEK